MEQFDDRSAGRPREKSVYLLHLDTPRIIIISCVLVGVLIIAFLIGMNLSTDDRHDARTVARQDMLFNPIPEEPIREGGELPGPDGQEGHNDPAPAGQAAAQPVDPSRDASQQAATRVPGDAIASGRHAPAQGTEKETRDVLTQDNIKEIIPPANTIKPERKEKTAITRQKTRSRKGSDPDRREVRQKSHRTVEVSSRVEKSERPSRGGYSIQVCAFDSRDAAQREVTKLKGHRYDPYIENTRINGKKFYRVRIGPLSSRSEAVKLPEEIQEMNRYERSYMIRE